MFEHSLSHTGGSGKVVCEKRNRCFDDGTTKSHSGRPIEARQQKLSLETVAKSTLQMERERERESLDKFARKLENNLPPCCHSDPSLPNSAAKKRIVIDALSGGLFSLFCSLTLLLSLVPFNQRLKEGKKWGKRRRRELPGTHLLPKES